jgi:hypothetical protein
MVISIDNFIQVSSYVSLRRRALDDQTYRSPDAGNEGDARLQTATSSGVYSIISVHKFDRRIVPKFFG